MMLRLLAGLQVLAMGGSQADSLVYDGRKGTLLVSVPRIETLVSVDGVLDEPVWSRAAILTGFSQYQPVDGRPSEDSTQVLVWYASTHRQHL